MSISGMGSTYNNYGYYGNGGSNINNLFHNNIDNSASSNSSNQSSSMPTIDALKSLVEYTSQVMMGMGVGSNERVTFSQISRYKEVLEKEFESRIKTGFDKLGIPIDTEFTITFDDDGDIKIKGDDPKVADIQKYFDDNPDMVDKYKEIQLLENLEGARKSLDINPAELRSRIQLESMTTWWASSGNSAGGAMANFSGGQLSPYQGVDKVV